LMTGARADELILTSGEIVRGNILRKRAGTVTIKSGLLGEINVPWAAVTSISTSDPMVVVLPGGRSVIGGLRTIGDKLEVLTGSETHSTPLSSVNSLRDYEGGEGAPAGLFDNWTASLDIGLAAARGNARTHSLNTSFDASRVTSVNKLTLYFKQLYATATIDNRAAATADAIRGGWAYSRNFHPRLFGNAFNDYEVDKFQNLNFRFVSGGGLGVAAMKREHTQLDLLAGISYNREQFTDDLTRNSAEVFWGDDWKCRLASATSLIQSFRLFQNLNRTGEYRINFDLGVVTSFSRWFAWQVTTSDRYLSNPVIGRQRNDLLVTTGFRLSFPR